MPTTERADSRAVAAALLTDAVCVLAFCAIGRRNHAEGITIAGVVETAWPFLAGAGVGWLGVRAWRRPTALAPQGIVIWLSCVVLGMLLRKATSQGTAVSFVVVASLSTAILLLGWRLAATVRKRR